MKDILKIGKIVGVHGIKGELKIYPYTNNGELFSTLLYIFIEDKIYNIKSYRNHKKNVIIQFENITNRNIAETYVNKFIYIKREQATPLEQNAYYIVDLIGCSVYEEEVLLGVIEDIIQTGSNDVYVVKNDNGDILIPALKNVVKKIDIKAKTIDVILPDGLIDNEII